jgi:DNA-binding winged helix-turn-helix (wHTH) protein
MERAELLRRAWPDTNVEKANLSQNVFTLRKALGDKANPAGPTKKKRGRCAAPLHGSELRALDD